MQIKQQIKYEVKAKMPYLGHKSIAQPQNCE